MLIAQHNQTPPITIFTRIYSNGQELTAASLPESKLLGELGLKDGQSLHISLYTRNNGAGGTVLLKKEAIPACLLGAPENFELLFKLVRSLSQRSHNCTKAAQLAARLF